MGVALKVLDGFQAAVVQRKGAIKALLPEGYEFSRFARTCITEIEKNPALATCTQESFVIACLTAAALGLDFNLKDAYLIPYKTQVKFQMSYMGLIKLATQGPQIDRMDADVVYEEDEFYYEKGLNPQLKHVPAMKDRGKMIGAYAIAFFANGEKQFLFMNEDDIEARHKVSKAKDSLMWKTFPERAYRKTVIIGLYPLLPKSEKMSIACAVDSATESGTDVPLAAIVDLPPEDYEDLSPAAETQEDAAAAQVDSAVEKAKPDPLPTKEDVGREAAADLADFDKGAE